MKRVFLVGWLAVVFFLGGCSLLPVIPAAGIGQLPTPTNYSFFNPTNAALSTPDLARPAGGTPTVARFFSPHATATIMMLPTSVAFADGPETATPPTHEFTDPVFTDKLNSNWSLAADPGMQFDSANTTHVHSGSVALAMTPKADFSKLSFRVSPNTKVAYQRDQVVSISFWLNSGNDYVNLSDLIVSLSGSNINPYWVENDQSVPTDNKYFFQETRLYFLGLNHAIPPETWAQVTVKIDNLTYDPIYKYITGFYIKNDAGFLRTVYIDDVEFLMIDNGGQAGQVAPPEATATPFSKATFEPTLLTPTRAAEPTPTTFPGIRPSLTSTPKP